MKSHTSTTPELHEEETKHIQSLNDEVNISLYETGEVKHINNQFMQDGIAIESKEYTGNIGQTTRSSSQTGVSQSKHAQGHEISYVYYKLQYVPKRETTEDSEILQMDQTHALESCVQPKSSDFGLGTGIQLGESVDQEISSSLEPETVASPSQVAEAKPKKQGALHNLASKFARALGVRYT